MARAIKVNRGVKGWWHVAAAAVGFAMIVGWLLFGTTGLFAWNDYSRLLTQRRAELAELKAEQAVLVNHQRLLNPRHADPDLVEEKLREEQNLLHPDDMVVLLR